MDRTAAALGGDAAGLSRRTKAGAQHGSPGGTPGSDGTQQPGSQRGGVRLPVGRRGLTDRRVSDGIARPAAGGIAPKPASIGDHRDYSRNSAACTQREGAVFHERRTRVWVPPVRGRRTLRRVARPTEHSEVADVEWCASGCERNDVIDGQVARRVGVALVARAPIAMLATPGAEHAGAETLPGPRAVQGVVPAAVGLPGLLRAAATRAAGDHAADRAELHGSRRGLAQMRAGDVVS
jgi:hypothetical protein